MVFVPSDTFQMAPPSVDRIGIALIASNLNYRREAPRASGGGGIASSFAVILLASTSERRRRMLKISRIVKPFQHCIQPPLRPLPKPSIPRIVWSGKKFASPSLNEIENRSFFHLGTINK